MKSFCLVLVAIATAIICFHAYSQMLFAIVSITSQDPVWIYTYPLYISLGLASLERAVKSWGDRQPSFLQKTAMTISGAASGALLGFFYFGSSTGNNPQMASIGAIISAILATIFAFFGKKDWIFVAIASAGIIATYGLSFLFIAKASANLSTHHLASGIFWLILFLIAIVTTGKSLILLIQQTKIFSTSV